MTKYRITREIYDRCGGEYKISTFKAENNLDALRKATDKCQYGFEYDNEKDLNLSEEKLAEYMHNVNGDGCDFIYSIINMSTGEVIFEEDVTKETEEDW